MQYGPARNAIPQTSALQIPYSSILFTIILYVAGNVYRDDGKSSADFLGERLFWRYTCGVVFRAANDGLVHFQHTSHT